MKLHTNAAHTCVLVIALQLALAANARMPAAVADTLKGPFEPTWESLKKNYRVPRWFQDGKLANTRSC